MPQSRPTKVLMIYPRFSAASFWNYAATCELVGARYPAAPLGLITVAAMLPKDWDIRLINRNTEELDESEILWADMVMTGGMLMQQLDTLELIEMCHRLGRPVAIGGPDATSSPHIYESADFRVLGEAEGILDQFIAAWEDGAREGLFEAEKFTADVTKTPVPRFDLLKFDHYLHVGIQFSRGCPFTCEFCDIIELYGRVPRTKTTAQMLAELDALYELGYRGHLDFVDDNLIGNKKAIKAFLPHLRDWLDAHDHPFELSTEASLNISDDSELMNMMREANFFLIFVGIESPDPDMLNAMRKKQNTRRSIAESVHRIYAHGMFVTAGFIVGFDNEKEGMAQAMVDLIEEAAIPVSVVGLLYALPNTQLTRRLTKEGRLYPDHDRMTPGQGDQTSCGLNFETTRPHNAVLRDFKYILERVYTPEAFCGRVKRMVAMLDRKDRKYKVREGDVRKRMEGFSAVHDILSRLPEHRGVMWDALRSCLQTNPDASRDAAMLMAFYLHLGPYSQQLIATVSRQIEALETQQLTSSQWRPHAQPAAALA